MPEPQHRRGQQPRCARAVDTAGKHCNHPLSFHGREHGRCRVTGCTCPQWLPPDRAATQMVFSDRSA